MANVKTVDLELVTEDKDPDLDRFSQLEKLVQKQADQIQSLTDSLKQGVKKPTRVLERSAKIMFVNNEPIVRFDSAREVAGHLLLPVTIQSKDGKNREELLPYLETLNQNPRYTCEILSQEATSQDLHQGSYPTEFNTRTLDPVGMREQGRQFVSRTIILQQTIVTYKAKVKFLDGPWKDREIEIDTKCLNP